MIRRSPPPFQNFGAKRQKQAQRWTLRATNKYTSDSAEKCNNVSLLNFLPNKLHD